MAKLPTFSASNVSGGGGAVQMQAQKRATTTPFRQSSNIKAEDIYNQAGDQALANAIGNVASLFNKVQLQKNEAVYVEKQSEMRQSFGNMMMEAEKHGKDADSYYREWMGRTKDSLTKTGNSSVDRRLSMEYAHLSVGHGLKITEYIGQVAKTEYLGSGDKLVSDMNTMVSKGETTPEDAIHEINLFYQNGIGNFYSKETAQNNVNKASIGLYYTDAKSKIENSTTLSELNASKNMGDKTEYLIGVENVERLGEQAKIRQKEIYAENKVNYARFKEDIESRANYGTGIEDTEMKEYADLFGEMEYSKLREDIQEVAVGKAIYDELSNMSGLTEENLDANASMLIAKLIEEAPGNSTQIIENVNKAKNIYTNVLKYQKKITIDQAVSQAVKQLIDGKLSSDDFEIQMFSQFGQEAVEAGKWHMDQYKKNPVSYIDTMSNPEVYPKVKQTLQDIFNPSVDRNAKPLLIESIREDYRRMQGERKRNHPTINAEIPEDIAQQIVSTLSSQDANMDNTKMDTVTNLVTLVGIENMLSASTQLADMESKKGNKANAAEMAVIIDGFTKGDNLTVENIRRAKNKYYSLKETEKKELRENFKKQAGDIFNALPTNDPIYNERLELAEKLFLLHKDTMEDAAKIAINQSFDQQFIKTPGYDSRSYTNIPNNYFSKEKGGYIPIDSSDLETKLSFVNNTLKDSPLEILPFDEIGKYSGLNVNSNLYKAVNSREDGIRNKARKEIAEAIDTGAYFWKFEPNGNSMSMNIRTKDSGASETLFKMPLDYILNTKIPSKEEIYGDIPFVTIYGYDTENTTQTFKDFIRNGID